MSNILHSGNSDTVISVEELGKRYQIAHQTARSGHGSLREAISNGAARWFRGSAHGETHGSSTEAFWALQGVSFDVKAGEVLGIVGRNGAGKSTLLKILSRVTEPTTGRVRLRGRAASLLEVGTGFHPELTGRENIFVNGSILGMTRREIQLKFPEIVDFAEVEQFLDTPVKRYSSGMYLRLAFAVAAHLSQEILIVDEVLAVGDIDFQRKCLGKMESVSRLEGRTVLFVSHNMAAVSSMCERGIYLEKGRIHFMGSVADTIERYLQEGGVEASNRIFTSTGDLRDNFAILREAYTRNAAGEFARVFGYNESVVIGIIYDQSVTVSPDGYPPYPQFNVVTAKGETAFISMPPNREAARLGNGKYRAECVIPAGFLNTGTYFVSVFVGQVDRGTRIGFSEDRALSFEIREDVLVNCSTIRNGYSGPIPGVVRPTLDWRIAPVD